MRLRHTGEEFRLTLYFLSFAVLLPQPKLARSMWCQQHHVRIYTAHTHSHMLAPAMPGADLLHRMSVFLIWSDSGSQNVRRLSPDRCLHGRRKQDSWLSFETISSTLSHSPAPFKVPEIFFGARGYFFLLHANQKEEEARVAICGNCTSILKCNGVAANAAKMYTTTLSMRKETSYLMTT